MEADSTPNPNDDKQDVGFVGSDRVDVLFVVDNSGSMREEQAKLVVHFESFMDELRSDKGELPDVQIGVVSTDLGTGAGIAGCETSDEGNFQGAQFLSNGEFLYSNADGNNLVEGSSLAATFTSMASLGTFGCGFEQPLESMRRALEKDNGFVRDDAHLVVVIVTDEDDCSVTSNDLFDPSDDSIYGSLNSFRCTRYGIVCDGGAPDSEGSFEGCQSAPTNELINPQEYADFINDLKVEGAETFVAVIGGPSDSFEVTARPDSSLALSHSCETADGVANPAVRLHEFAKLVTSVGVSGSICNPSYEDYLVQLAETVRGILER